MDELEEFLNSIPGLPSGPAPIIQGAGNTVLDVEDDEFDFDDSDPEPPMTVTLVNSAPPPIETDDLILGPVCKDRDLTVEDELTYTVERYYMDIRDDLRLNSKGRPFVEGAHSRYETLHEWVQKHAVVHGQVKLFQVNDKWLRSFIHFLHHQDLSLNTVAGYVNNLHAMFTNLADDVPALPKLTMRVSPEAANSVFNSEEELKTLLNTTFSQEAFTVAMQIFVMQSYLGFRVGTLQKFLREPQLYLFKTFIEDEEKWLIQIRTNKTGFIVTVPVKALVLDILKSRNYTFEPAYYERYYNPLIKLMAYEAGLDYIVPYTITYGNKLREFRDPKCQLMASHTARRNFATNAFLAGVHAENIMWITGHTTLEAFYRYIRCDSLANAIAMAKHPFFQ